LEEFERFTSGRGYSSHNVADMLAILARMEALRGGDQAQLAQIRQSTAAMLLARISVDISRQRLAENAFRSKS
jgi:DNA-binding MarR family transcriptional regulator